MHFRLAFGQRVIHIPLLLLQLYNVLYNVYSEIPCLTIIVTETRRKFFFGTLPHFTVTTFII